MVKSNDIIVLKKAEDETPPKKGGVWKIAHADFMTAMMAFFLIMWLVNATDEEIKKSIANYFNPMNLTVSPSAVKGVENPTEETAPPAAGEEDGKKSGDQPVGAEVAGEGGSALGEVPAGENAEIAASDHGATGEGAAPQGDQKGGGNVEEGNERTMASAGILDETDGAAFNDPFAQVASAATDFAPERPMSVDTAQTTLGEEGTQANTEDVRDPFDPAYWQTVQTREARSLRPGRSNTADVPPPDAEINAGAATPRGESPEVSNKEYRSRGPTSDEAADPRMSDRPQVAVGPRSAVADTILATISPPAAAGVAGDAPPRTGVRPRSQEARAAAAAQDLQKALAGADGAADVAVTAGDKTVLISLTDGNAISMFPIGSSSPTRAASDLFERVGSVLAERDGRIIVRGHTDARPFTGGTSDNWTLSFQRAHATKNALVAKGVDERRFVRVEGLADRQPARPDDPFADENRRIEILYQPPAEAPSTATRPAAAGASPSAAPVDPENAMKDGAARDGPPLDKRTQAEPAPGASDRAVILAGHGNVAHETPPAEHTDPSHEAAPPSGKPAQEL